MSARDNNKSVSAHEGAHAPKQGLRGVDKNVIKRLLEYVGKYKSRFILVVICILLSSGASVASSLFLRTLIDDYIAPLLLEAEPVFAGLLRALVIMACIYIAGIICSLTYSRTMAVISQGTIKRIRDDMFAHMQGLPIKYFDTHTHGDVMSRYTNDTDSLGQMISNTLPQVISSVTTLVMVSASMLITSIWLTLVVFAFVALMLQATKYVAKNSSKYFFKQQSALGGLNGYIEEMINGQKVVKVFCHENDSKADFDKRNDELRDNATKANQFANILMPLNGKFGYMLYVIVAIAGGALAISGAGNLSLLGRGALTLGAISTFLQLTRNFMRPIGMVSQQLNSVAMALAGAKRIFELIDEPVETDNGYVTLVNAVREPDGTLKESERRTGIWAWKHPHGDGTLTYAEVKGHIELNMVDFAYEEGKDVLHDITMYAEPGQKVALVGATGAGKTTITNLINRFYDIADGKIRYDGININKIKKDDLRRSLGVVLQDVNLFTGTVMDNIRYGKLDASDDECRAAAKLANADDFIERLPGGYDTMLTDNGSELSQGQRQLISIARAAVADPPVMILDEATSSIDTRTETIVQRGMDALMSGRTVFVIAHRLSTVKNADVIMVLDHGRIIERGSHDELIAEQGQYYRLYTGAFELD